EHALERGVVDDTALPGHEAGDVLALVAGAVVAHEVAPRRRAELVDLGRARLVLAVGIAAEAVAGLLGQRAITIEARDRLDVGPVQRVAGLGVAGSPVQSLAALVAGQVAVGELAAVAASEATAWRDHGAGAVRLALQEVPTLGECLKAGAGALV